MDSTIFAVGLVSPKPNVFQPHIKHLLVLATALNIAILGVTFKKVTSVDGNFFIAYFIDISNMCICVYSDNFI